ncbi:MAG TPA: hypothetical protein VF403_00650 [Kofleriaceae bacterium]
MRFPFSTCSVVLLGLAGCLGGGSGARPGVMPKLSELPSDPGQRDTILDQSNQAAGPEQRRTSTPRERKAETAAAFAAAMIGTMFSSSSTVTLGVASALDENDLGPTNAKRPRLLFQDTPDAPAPPATAPPPPPEPNKPAGQLVPWVLFGTR